MRFVHPSHGAAKVRLAYCTNLHAGETLPEIRQGLEQFSLGVKRELNVEGSFGIGLYLPAKVALYLASQAGRSDLESFSDWLRERELEAFTFNAFPYGGFQRDGLKEDVYRPTWETAERAQYTAAVAKVAGQLARWSPDPNRHISISTHPGAHLSQVGAGADIAKYTRGLARAVVDLVQEQKPGVPPIVLSVEAEPWAIAGDSMAMAGHLHEVASLAVGELIRGGAHAENQAREAVARHLGSCLDACHSAVEFESPVEAVRLAHRVGAMGKLQYSNALSLREPAASPRAIEALLALDEPRFLHQVRGHSAASSPSAGDLGDLQDSLERGDSRGPWLDCEEWRCHFHVPVNLPEFEGLGTTQAHADAILKELLLNPADWKTRELHVEIETYTWSILPGHTPDGLVAGLVQEYQHVLALLALHGWERSENE